MIEVSTEEKHSGRSMGLVAIEQLPFYAEEIVAALKSMPRFLEYYTIEWVFEQAKEQRIQVWVLGDQCQVDLVLITRVLALPKLKVFQVIGAAGKKLDLHLARIDDVFDRTAAMFGCDRIEIVGRPGWLRKLKAFRAELDYCILSRAVGAMRSH